LSESTSGKRRALLIGINHYYLDESIGNLRYCVNDVVELDKILTDESRGNFRSSQLLHSEMDDVKSLPTRSNIMSLTSRLANNSESKDTILFYFAGHGFEQDNVNYLLPADSCRNILADTAISLKWIKETVNKSLARKKFIIIDACHSGSELGRSNSIAMSKSFHDEMFSEAEGCAILSSCKIGQLSYEYPEKSHGVFSYYLLEGLKGSADNDGDGIITVPDVNKYVWEQMREWSITTGHEQHPTFYYKVSGEFIFVRTSIQQKTGVNNNVYPVFEIPRSIYLICQIVDAASFMSDNEFKYKQDSFDQLRSYLFIRNTTEKGKAFLEKISITRFSSLDPKEFLMQIAAEITEVMEIKKWLKKETQIKHYFILEFITSRSFDYAGTMAHIINNMLPTVTDDELLEIIEGIEKNNQIQLSFKARTYLWSIVDAAKTIMPIERYRKLLEILNM
jgi:hypothetical protein